MSSPTTLSATSSRNNLRRSPSRLPGHRPNTAKNLRAAGGVALWKKISMGLFMISLEERISRTERLLRRLEEDEPYLQVRVAALGSERQQEVNAFAARIRAEAEAELERLLAERGTARDGSVPQPAD